MKLRNFKTLMIMVLLANVSNVSANNLPDFPGFSWYNSTNNIGTFLKPDGWHVHEQMKGSTNALFITYEKIKDKGSFAIGLSVNKVTMFSKTSSLKPSVYAKLFSDDLKNKFEVIKATIVKAGASDMNIVRVKGTNNEINTIIHYIVIGIDNKDELFIISFEAPESKWEANYDKAGPMLNYFLL